MRVELSIIIDKLKKKILKKVEGGLSGGIYDKDGSVDEREEEGREIFKRKEMLLIGEVGKRIEKNERMDVVNEGIDGSKNEKDMGVDEEDNKLVEVKVFNELKKVGKMEGDVEKFGKKSIGGEGSKFVKDEMMLRRGGGKERKKNIVEKGEVEWWMIVRMRSIEKRKEVLMRKVEKEKEIEDKIENKREVWVVKEKEIEMNVVDKKKREGGIGLKVSIVGGKEWILRNWIIGDFGNGNGIEFVGLKSNKNGVKREIKGGGWDWKIEKMIFVDIEKWGERNGLNENDEVWKIVLGKEKRKKVKKKKRRIEIGIEREDEREDFIEKKLIMNGEKWGVSKIGMEEDKVLNIIGGKFIEEEINMVIKEEKEEKIELRSEMEKVERIIKELNVEEMRIMLGDEIIEEESVRKESGKN